MSPELTVADEPDTREIRLGDRPLVRYRYRTGPAPAPLPPHLHPIRTLAGEVLTAVGPDDHPWHAGLSVAVPLVDGHNFWGGPTYRRRRGYVELDDHGSIRHRGWLPGPDGELAAELAWTGRDGCPLLVERRTAGVVRVDPGAGAWTLTLRTLLRNVTERPLRFGSPATEGRAGAGYGGVFWRGPLSLRGATVRTPGGTGERAAHGGTGRWVALSGRGGSTGCTAVFVAVGGGEWFVRSVEYPGVCRTVAAREPLMLAPGDTLRRGLDMVVADGEWPRDRIEEYLGASRSPR